MKKLIIIVLVFVITVPFALCEEPNLDGGWTPSENWVITDETNALFEKAFEGLLGVSYKPVAYLGSQVVAGCIHCFLAQATVIYPDARPYYVLVYIYEDLEGNTEILNISKLDIGYLAQPETPEV